MPQKKKVSRTVIKINERGVCKLLATLAHPDGMHDPGFGNAVRWAKSCFYASKGNETRPITDEEASKQVKKGFNTGQL
jgi:hypothetical protein